MKNYSLLRDIMINKLSKLILMARKGIFFSPTENMDVLLALCKRMCAIKRLHQLAYARVKLFPIPLHWFRMFCLLH